MLHLGVHDTSRIAWMVELELPDEGETTELDLRMAFEIPAHVFSEHDPWSRLQLLARLGSPIEEGPRGMVRLAGADSLRWSALAAAHRAKITRRKLLREAVETSRTLRGSEGWQALGEALRKRVEDALADLRIARDEIASPRAEEPDDIRRERRLASEFLSNHVIELVSRTQRSIDQLSASPNVSPKEMLHELLAELRPALARGLAAELDYRREQGFPSPQSTRPEELERFVSRSSSLKKHFQEILFLKVESRLAGSRFRYLASAAAAILAALFVIPITALATGSHGLKGFGLGVSSSFLIIILAYGVRERIKEGVRGWLTARAAEVGRLTTLGTPSRPPVAPVRVGRVRETFSTSATEDVDPAHPDLRSSIPVIRLGYRMQGDMEGDSRLAWHGSRTVKLVFRYDLTPLFSRLHDPVAEVPVLDETGQRLTFAEAPRLYRIPIDGELRYGSTAERFEGTLLAHKYGLVRIEPSRDSQDPLEERAASLFAGIMRRR